MENEKFIGIEEAAKLLGLQTKSVYQMVFHKRIPYYKPTRNLLFKVSELLQFIEESRQAPIYESEEKAVKYLASKGV